MENTPVITLEDMMSESELFCAVYPDLIGEIDRIEKTRGKLNDFQLMRAVSYAKNGLGVLSYERRRTINAIFETYTDLYRREGRSSADLWAGQTLGCVLQEQEEKADDVTDAVARVNEIAVQIQEKESELLKLYREFYMLQSYLGNAEGPAAKD